MHIESIVMGEGLAQDADGLFSLIRIGQNILTPARIPAQTKRAFIVLLVEDEGEDAEGETYDISFSFHDPDGEVLFAQSAGLQLGEKRYKDLPSASWIPGELVLTVSGEGSHKLQATLRKGSQVLDRKSVDLHVRIQPPELTSL